MPSPGIANPIKVLIHGTSWLEPVESEPCWLPTNIPVGSVVEVPGQLKCLIRNETAPRPAGQQLFVKDEITLIASFDRLERSIPEFNGKAEVDIQYPLILEAPKVLLSVAKGDIVRFHWVVCVTLHATNRTNRYQLRNISSKACGYNSSSKRAAATCLVDPGGVFNLTYSEAAQGGEAVDELDYLEPGAAVPIDQDFRVSQHAEDYSYGYMRLELRLSHPNKVVQARTIGVVYGIQLQISGKYTYDPDAQFLLIVNSHTPLFAIHQIRRYIWDMLSLRVDTFNISLYGSLDDPETGKNVCERYIGKSIIIFGNTLPFFDTGDRQPWDLLDPWQVCTYAKAGTSILFLSPMDFKSLDSWSRVVSFPVSGVPMTAGKDAKNGSELAKELQKESHTSLHPSHSLHKVSGKKATSAAKQMSKKLPLKRYLAIHGENGVSLIEGLPKTAQVFASNVNFVDGQTLADYHAFIIIRSIPFPAQVRMFWNLAGKDIYNGVLRNQLYAGLPEFKPRELPGADRNSLVVSSTVRST